MSNTDAHFTLRAMQPSDSAAVASLITEFDGDMTTRFSVDAYTAITSGTESPTLGVVAECAGQDGLVGMGTVRFSQVQFNDQTLPLAFLDGLKVHRDFRGRGLGYQIAAWRIQKAKEMYGDRCVLATGMLQANRASYAVAKKWCREFVEPAFDVVIVPTRKQPAKALAGVSVREIAPDHFEEFAARQNGYYKHHNLYPPASARAIAAARAVSAGGRKPYRFFAAVDTHGSLLAGAQTWARGILKSDSFNNPPLPLRLLNRALHMLPADFTIRDIAVSGLWHAPNQVEAARLLWDHLRWACQDQGTTLAASFDPRDPGQAIVRLKPWHQPRPKITLAIHGPAPINRERLLFGVGRV